MNYSNFIAVEKPTQQYSAPNGLEVLNPYSNSNLGYSSIENTTTQQPAIDKLTQYLKSLKIQEPSDLYNYDSSPKTTTSQKNTRAYVKSTLIQKFNLSNEQASALTGVWYAESNLKPHIHEIGKESNPYAGQGIAQWTGKQRQQHARDIYKRIYGKDKQIKQMTLDEQINVAVAEFKERTGNWQRFLNAKNLNEAVDIVWRGYENGGTNQLASMAQMRNVYRGNTDKQLRDRLRFSREIFNL